MRALERGEDLSAREGEKSRRVEGAGGGRAAKKTENKAIKDWRGATGGLYAALQLLRDGPRTHTYLLENNVHAFGGFSRRYRFQNTPNDRSRGLASENL